MGSYIRKTKLVRHSACTLILLLAGMSSSYALTNDETTGDIAAGKTPLENIAAGSAITGSFNLDANSHFISYGADVWGTGDSWNDIMIHPSLTLNMDLGGDFYGFVGSWLDINNIGKSGLGDNIQELDLWVGLGRTYEKWNFSLTYQEWIYASDVERIFDIAVSYDTFLNPSLVIHNRVEGNGGQETGTVFVLGVSEGTDYQGVNCNLGLNVAFNTDDFHGGESGLTYVSLSPQFKYLLSNISKAYGNWNVHGGLTFYYTPDNTIPNNPTETFMTGNLGIGIDF